jgi:hypothetical protein
MRSSFSITSDLRMSTTVVRNAKTKMMPAQHLEHERVPDELCSCRRTEEERGK